MKVNATALLVTLVFVAILGVALLGGGATGQATGASFPITNGTILSVLAALLAIGVLIVAGLQQTKE